MIKERLILKKIKKYVDPPEAIILTGMRRTGKTTLLKYIYEKNNSSNKLFLDLENPVNRKYFDEENYEKIKKAFEFLGKKGDRQKPIQSPEKRMKRPRTKRVSNPNEDSHQPERSGVHGQKNQLFSKKNSFKRDGDS